MLHSKLHRATVTHADLKYEGSITIPPELLLAADIAEFEEVSVWNVTNGARFETYTIKGEVGGKNKNSNTVSKICINGAAARLVQPDDIVIIACFRYMSGEQLGNSYKPKVVFLDENNQVKSIRDEVVGPYKVAV